MTALPFLGGLALLVGGAELLVFGASRLARSFDIPRVVVGLTVVAFGTSSPELAVGVGAALRGAPDLAFGNVCGSNIFNVMVILGLSALVAPLIVSRRLVRLEVPLMILVSVAALFFARGGVSRGEGACLVGALVAYVAFQVRQARRAGTPREGGGDRVRRSATARLGFALAALAGVALLVLGSDVLVTASVAIARSLGMSDLVVGLTIVAAGTSLPEVSTSVVAAYRGEREIAVANVVGSNVFNLLGVLGAAAAASLQGIPVPPEALNFDVPVMIASAVACLPMFLTGPEISRWEGALFLSYYIAYVAFLVQDFLPHYWIAGPVFVLPLAAGTLGLIVVRARRRGEDGEDGEDGRGDPPVEPPPDDGTARESAVRPTSAARALRSGGGSSPSH